MAARPSIGSGSVPASERAVGIRPLRRRDLPGVVELQRRQWPDDVSNVESMAWHLDHPDPGERIRRWVATDGGVVVGWASGGLATWTSDRVGFAFFGVREDRRGQGIGRRLWVPVDTWLARLEPTSTISGSALGDEASAGFLARRGFAQTRRDQAWVLDPRTAPLEQLSERTAAAEAAGYRLVPVRDLLGRPKDLYRLHRALQDDLPSDVPVGEAYGAWRLHELDSPLFCPDASFCLVVGDDPVALTWISVDWCGHRAGHGLTGTLPGFRHRGFARLVKLASIRWLADHGVTALYTDNDSENHEMLTLNDHLGYRPLIVYQMWSRPRR